MSYVPAFAQATLARVRTPCSVAVGSITALAARSGASRPQTFVRDAAGLYHGVFLSDQSRVDVFDGNGQLVSTYGGVGNSPGQFRAVTRLQRWRGDSIAAWDWGNRRIQVFADNYANPRVEYVEALGFESVVLGDGRIVFAGIVRTPARVGFALHTLGRGGVLENSFDGSVRFRNDGNRPHSRLSIAADSAGTLWTVRADGLSVQRWTPDGTRLDARNIPFPTQGSEGPVQFQRTMNVRGIALGTAGLWIHWRAASGQDIVEIRDTATLGLRGSHRVSERIHGWIEPGIAFGELTGALGGTGAILAFSVFCEEDL